MIINVESQRLNGSVSSFGGNVDTSDHTALMGNRAHGDNFRPSHHAGSSHYGGNSGGNNYQYSGNYSGNGSYHSGGSSGNSGGGNYSSGGNRPGGNYPSGGNYSGGRNYSSGGGYSGKGHLVCEFCHYKGHTRENCYKLHGYPTDLKNKKRGKEVRTAPNYANNATTGPDNVADSSGISTVHNIPATPTAPFFTLEQYNQIMQMLQGKQAESVANAASIGTA
ncbi:uncharacterized protein LOC132615503 [Lycium barbarum]|uniref:uncharacterized protein LOC132615503 n=1 Tax=Lycium barbarum TaxID=112863 RepID=UPI00293ECDBA|nr:uncharacterized protein LOC132615503 [Lycium barbarum]